MMTLAEYLEDYSSDKTKEAGYQLIENEILKISDPVKRSEIKLKIDQIKRGKRDLLY